MSDPSPSNGSPSERWETFRQVDPDRWCVRKGRIVSDLKFFRIRDAGVLAELLNEKDEAISACEKIMDAVAGHTDWHPSPDVDEDNWNEEAHIEPTITVADCRALKEVLRKAGKLEQYMPWKENAQDVPTASTATPQSH